MSGKRKKMSKSSHLELHDTDSVDLAHLDSVSLGSEPPDIRNWFPSYVYESPELNTLDGFHDSNCQEATGKNGNNHPLPVGHCNHASAAHVESESLPFSAEPPDIRNWFSSYMYESPQLDTIIDFANLDYDKEREYGQSFIGEQGGDQNKNDWMTSIKVEPVELCNQMNTSDAVVKDTKLDHQSVSKEDDDVSLQPLSSSIQSLSNSDNDFDTLLSGQRAGYDSHNSLEKTRSVNSYGSEYDARPHNTLSNRKPVYSSIEGNDYIEDDPENEDIYDTHSPRTIDRILPEKDSQGTLLEDGFISVRKRSYTINDENTNGVKSMINHGNDARRVRKVLSETSNFHSKSIVGKWSCPQKNKPDTGPPLKQVRLDQWVRRV